jgi:DNA-binding MarR family transcriptional regulator
MEKTDLIKEIVGLQRKVDRARSQYELDVWIGLNVTLPQLKSLFFIGHQGTTNLSTLAAALGVTPTNVTGIVERLVKQNLVSRTENPEDRRMLLLRTTKEGEELINRLRERRRDYFSRVLAGMSADELSNLAGGFASLVEAIEDYEEKSRVIPPAL